MSRTTGVFWCFLTVFGGYVAPALALNAADVLFGGAQSAETGENVFEASQGVQIPDVNGEKSTKNDAPQFHFSDGVIAEVNDDILTSRDLEGQVLLAARQYEILPVSEAVFQRQILEELIEDTIKRQYALSKKLNVTEEELQAAIGRIAATNGVSADQFLSVVKGLEGPFRNKVAIGVLWDKVIQTELLPQIEVSTADIDRLIKDIIAGDVVSEREISQIFLPSSVKGAQDILIKAKQDIEKETGDTFGKVAQEISKGGAADKGGYLGWVKDGAFNETLEELLVRAKAGDIVGPVQTDAGWHLMKVHRIKTIPAVQFEPIREVEISLISIPADDEKVIKNIKKKSLNLNEIKEISGVKIEDFSLRDVKAFDPKIQAALPDQLGLGNIIEEEGMFVIPYVKNHKKRMPENLLALREKVEKKIKGNRLRMLERQLLRQIKSRAYVNIVERSE